MSQYDEENQQNNSLEQQTKEIQNENQINENIKSEKEEQKNQKQMDKNITIDQTNNENEFPLHQAYNLAILERKTKSFKQLKNWDENRLTFLNLHTAICEAILKKLEKKISFVIMISQQIISFFKERALQDLNYSKFKLPKLQFHGFIDNLENMNKNSISKQENSLEIENKAKFDGLKQVFNQFENYHQQKNNQMLSLSEFIDKYLINENLQKYHNEFLKKSNQNKDKGFTKKKLLIKVSQETIQLSSKYTQLFYEQVNQSSSLNQQKIKQKDLYSLQLQFMRKVDSQLQQYKHYGNEIIQYWQDTVKDACVLIESIQKCLQHYIMKYEDVFGSSQSIELTKHLLQKMQSAEEIEQFFSIEEVLSQQELQTIYQFKINKDSESIFTLQDIGKFLRNFMFQYISEEPLILKSIKALKENTKISHQQNKDCILIFTVDNFLIILEGQQETIQQFSKNVEEKFYIPQLTFKENKKKQNSIIIQHSKQGFIFKSNKKLVLSFVNEDVKEEFLQTITFWQSKQFTFPIENQSQEKEQKIIKQ